jgi:hypothetical protein
MFFMNAVPVFPATATPTIEPGENVKRERQLRSGMRLQRFSEHPIHILFVLTERFDQI